MGLEAFTLHCEERPGDQASPDGIDSKPETLQRSGPKQVAVARLGDHHGNNCLAPINPHNCPGRVALNGSPVCDQKLSAGQARHTQLFDNRTRDPAQCCSGVHEKLDVHPPSRIARIRNRHAD